MLGRMRMIRTLLLFSAAVALVLHGTRTSGAQSALSIQSGVDLSWPATTGNTYRVQWAVSPGGPWTNLSAPLPGNPPTNSFYDPIPVGARLYRVLEIVPGSAPTASMPANGGFELGSGTT